jgi:hypothetical protein
MAVDGMGGISASPGFGEYHRPGALAATIETTGVVFAG